ncbi:hypothetical protein MPSEU_000978000 [Mayamaea pseudoterrestris]|nr:hypothetical protein MPSEU_000978000 [Mayamaea pseudoterrestris]
MLGQDGAAKLAKAMLADVLVTLTNEVNTGRFGIKVLLFAPPTDDSREMMRKLLVDELNIASNTWVLLPVLRISNERCNDILHEDASSTSQQLTPLLTDALIRVRSIMADCNDSGSVVFLGMDSPQLNLEELTLAVRDLDDEEMTARICPCPDGGYGMLSVPAGVVASDCFRGILWSHSLTALAQIKALTDVNVHVKLGRLMYDIDEPHDVRELCRRLQMCSVKDSHNNDSNCLLKSSLPNELARTSDCPKTRSALRELGLI